MFRAALFSIVLTLAVGQNAGLLCTVWCPEATSTECPHRDSTTSPSVRADDNCTTVAVARSLVREDARRRLRPRTPRALSPFFGSDSSPHQLTRAAAMSRGGGCCSKNDLSLSPSESKSRAAAGYTRLAAPIPIT